uniref:Glutamate synthase [NADPH] large chain (EC) n=1 Tax=uncultured Thiotrichaceae bacterium TaxID=298394 RepID=A0A6S6ULT5_9GAMM|nr:MAG: Glutamate synthase [NADPH] large chain (EC [uncultured Thiotrichaceae bacterium]
MTNNDVLRRLRYTLNLSDSTMISIFGQAASVVTREQVSNWLKKDDDPDYEKCSDQELALFLNGLINHRRGKKEGVHPAPEKKLSHNIILKKLKIAFNLTSDDMLDVICDTGQKLSKHELSAFFRKPNHKHYRQCKDQVLRNFLQGLQDVHRQDDVPAESVKEEKAPVAPKVVKAALTTKPAEKTPKAGNQAVWSKVSVPDSD